MNLFFFQRNSAMVLYNSSLAHTQLEISHCCTWWCTTLKCGVRLMMITHQLCFFIYFKHMNYGMHIIDRILGVLAINLWILNVPCLIAKQKSIYIFVTWTTLSDNFLLSSRSYNAASCRLSVLQLCVTYASETYHISLLHHISDTDMQAKAEDCI